MLKTHKQYYDLFKKIHSSKSLLDYAKALDLEGLFEEFTDPSYYQHFEGVYYRKNKELVDQLAREQGLGELLVQ